MRLLSQPMYMMFPRDNNQSGVSLMLAVLVLAAITAVAFSLATIVFIEIRASGDALRTEPTLYGSFAVTEEALFQYKRFATSVFDVTACPSSQSSDSNNICHINGVTLTPGTPIAFDDSPRVEFVPANTTRTIPMYVPSTFDQQYDSGSIQVLPNGTSSGVEVSFKIWYADGSYTETGTATVVPNTTYPFPGFSSQGQYEIILRNPSSTQDVSVSVTTHRVGGATPEGLPFVGEQVMRIRADYQGLSRTYQVRIPIP